MPPLPPLLRLARLPPRTPLLRLRIPHHHPHYPRHTSTTTTTTAAPPPPPTSRPPPRPRRHYGAYITWTVFLGLGFAAGHLARMSLAPPPLPPAGSEMDVAFRASVARDLDALPLVQQLAHSSHNEGGEGGVWQEVGAGASPSAGSGGAEVSFVRDTLAGMHGLGPWRRWRNSRSGECVTVFWLGGGVTGWPMVAHGGFIATMFVEGFKDAVAEGAGTGTGKQIDTTNLTLTYLAPTLATNFYVLRTAPAPQLEPGTGLPPQKDMTKKPKRGGPQEEEMTGTLETVNGKVCVKAKAVVRQ